MDRTDGGPQGGGRTCPKSCLYLFARQRSSGNVLGQNAWFLESEVKLISRKYSVWYPEGETNPEVIKAFCHVCGGIGYSKSGFYLLGTVVVAVGTFADTSFPIPKHVHWWGSKPDWVESAEESERITGN